MHQPMIKITNATLYDYIRTLLSNLYSAVGIMVWVKKGCNAVTLF
jgi:hypothetical protein